MNAKLSDIASRRDIIGDIRGRGAMVGIELVSDRARKTPIPTDVMKSIMRGCLQRGVVVLKAGQHDNVLRLLPPLTIDEDLLEEGLSVVDEVLSGVDTTHKESGGPSAGGGS
jgi:4-aminobutyrate aminotransferase/(S)-3-amino-2-methylpropionate transaminase